MFLWNIAVTSLAEVWIEIARETQNKIKKKVTSLAEVWIEMWKKAVNAVKYHVTSLAEVWIEIMKRKRLQKRWRSLPLRKCGLKYFPSSNEVNLSKKSLPLRKCGLKL